MKLLYQGHGSFRLTLANDAVIYIDPFAGEGYEKPADLILVTHQHPDHDAVGLPAKKPDCRIYQNTDALRAGVYQTLTFAGAEIEAVEAYNKNHDPASCVGYIIRAEGLQLYFAGDTSKTARMEKLTNMDYAFLPADGVFNMDIPEAMECAALIGARHTVPVHIAPGKLFDPERAARFTVPGALIFEPGKEYDL